MAVAVAKRCSKCSEEKPLDGFSRRRTSQDGRDAQCKRCVAAYGKARYEAKRERILAEQRTYAQVHPEIRAAYRESNRDRANDYNRRYYEANRERVKTAKKRHREANRERLAANFKQYYQANRTSLLEKQRAYSKAHPEQVLAANARRRAAKRQAPIERFGHKEIFIRDDGMCGICCFPVDPADWHLDHIQPLARGGSHTRDNVQVSHPACNMRKGAGIS